MTVFPRPLPLNHASLEQATKWLAARDPALASVYYRFGLAPLWRRPATFATLVRIILEQQVSLSAAKATFWRLAERCGGQVTANAVQKLDDAVLREVGLSRQKARYVRELSVAVRERRFSVRKLRDCTDDEAANRIRSLLGFGAWSADIYLMMALLRPDVLPTGDLGLIKGIEELDGRSFDRPEAIINRAEVWRPWRSVATRMVWQLYLVNRGKDVRAVAKG
jgi:DNA-3-methyladenine glycosylase II